MENVPAINKEPAPAAATGEKADNPDGPPVSELAAREVKCWLHNTLNVALYRDGETIAHGKWTTDMYPPEIVEAGEWAKWQTQSDGMMTGTEGTTNYKIFISDDANEVVSNAEEDTVVQMWWANPFSGGNQYNAGIVGPRRNDYKIKVDGGGGNHSTVTYTLSKK
ncbi:predicted protein [Uncinocarpus reesii 1704]|uniref:Uncharacterized protein n=1 Tax=Uncinocarpus reesii (strain UAMH 1704) TaxID=336963 RepID=C4JTW6_UNCRE|nr:uncharacterized protein UREG_05905 [Uncinocarpus reesii 1704]EEP81063.1 predicted protein [Uncinocarpus reesii 1704]